MKPVWAIIAVFLLAAGRAPLLSAGVNAETGSYIFQHYTPEQYNAAPENWAAAQDSRGIMYFGNTSALLEYDGQTWRSIPLSNGSFGRSVGVDSKGTVYAGGVGVFGVLRPDRDGSMRFVPLIDRVPEADRKFRDVWRVLPTPQGVYFTAYERLFRLNADGSIHVWRPVSNFGRAVTIGDSVYVKAREQGLLRVEGDALVPVPGGEIFKSIGVTAAATTDRGGLIATPTGLFRIDSSGIAPFPTAADAYFAAKQLYTITVFPDGEIAAGTRTGGLVLLNRDGGLDRILTRASGLTDDYVAAIFRDRQGGIWLAGSNGITFVNPGLTRFGENLGLKGLVRFVGRANGSIYAGSTSGLFRMNTAAGREPSFGQIPGIDNTVTWIVPVGNQILAATDVGLYSVTGDRAVAVLPEARKTSVFGIVASALDPSVIYTAGFAGIRMLRQSGNGWKKAAEFAVNGQTFQSLSEDPDGHVWAATNDAIWRLDLRGEKVAAESFGEPQGVPPGLKNPRLFHGHTVFATTKGLLRFSESAKRFEADNELGAQFADGSRDVFDLVSDPKGNVWVTGAHYHGVLLKQGDGYRWLNAPLLTAGIQELYGLAFDDNGVAWAYGAGGVLYRWEQALYGNPDENFQVITRRIGTEGEGRTIFGGAGSLGSVRLPYRENALRFEFAAPFSEQPGSVEYQVKLEGSDKDWSAWSHEPYKEKTNLFEGSYTFRVRARSPHGAIAESSALSFAVLPPWYRTWWAYGVYIAMLGVIVWGFVKWRTRQLVAEKEHLEHIVEERTVEIREQRDEIHRQERQGHALLLNILPESVAQELKTNGAVRRWASMTSRCASRISSDSRFRVNGFPRICWSNN